MHFLCVITTIGITHTHWGRMIFCVIQHILIFVVLSLQWCSLCKTFCTMNLEFNICVYDGGKWIYGRCARVIRVTAKSLKKFACMKCRGNILERQWSRK